MKEKTSSFGESDIGEGLLTAKRCPRKSNRFLFGGGNRNLGATTAGRLHEREAHFVNERFVRVAIVTGDVSVAADVIDDFLGAGHGHAIGPAMIGDKRVEEAVVLGRDREIGLGDVVGPVLWRDGGSVLDD